MSNNVTCIPIVRQQVGKHIPAEENARKNMASFARQRINKHTFLTVETVFSVWSVQSGYKEVFRGTKNRTDNGVEFRDASLPGYRLESRRLELSRQLQINGKKGVRLS